jgi:hypothetical protein
MHQLALWTERDRSEVWATSYRLAKSLDLSPSSHFRAILGEMVTEGVLVARKANKSGRWAGLEYALKPGTYKPPTPRTVSVKVRGQQVGQLALW